jgi:low affinity Fe/Cu permease
MQIKLDELLAMQRGASNQLIDIENLSEQEVRELHRRVQLRAERCRTSAETTAVRSIEEVAAPCELEHKRQAG